MIILDIETKNLEPIGNGITFGNPANWRTSCVCVLEVVGPTPQHIEPHVFVEKSMVAELESQGIVCKSFEHLSDFLNNCLEDELPLLTHNGKGFDLPILMKDITAGGASCHDVLTDYEKLGFHMDTAADLSHKTGKRFHLQDLIKGVLGPTATKMMNAADAPIEWHNGNYEAVLNYCLSDCLLTYQMFYIAADEGVLEAAPSKGKKEERVLVEDWHTWLELSARTFK